MALGVGLLLPFATVELGLWVILWSHLPADLLVDRFFNVSLVVLTLGLIITTSTYGRLVHVRSISIIFGLIAALTVIVEVVSFNFLRVTGSVLEFDILVFGVTKLSNAFDVIVSETPGWIIGSMIGAPIILLAMPEVVRYLMRDKPKWEGEVDRKVVVLGFLLSVLSLMGAFMMPTGDSPGLARHPVIHLAITGFERLTATGSAVNLNYMLLAHTNAVRASDAPPPNIVFIMLESTRASATELHGGPEGVSPFLKELATTSLVAERAQTVVPHTSKALVAINCGFEPVLTMHILEADRGIPGKCLPHLLKPHGYDTKFIQSAQGSFENRRGLVRNMGFEEFASLDDLDTTGFEPTNYFGVEDHVMIAPLKEWLTKERQNPFFLSILTISPHHQYFAPENMVKRHHHSEEDEFDRYLHSIKITDDFVRRFFDLMKETGLYDNTVFVVVGDHGEGFGEHGRFQHDNVIYQEGIHVPLLFHDGRSPTAGKIEENLSQIDIVPSVLEMAGFLTIGGEYPGLSVLGPIDPNRPIFSACWYERNCASVLVRDTKFIHHFGRQPDEAFLLSKDPDERANIIVQTGYEPQLESLLEWWLTVNSWYDRHYSKSLQDVVHDTPPDVKSSIGAVYPNGVTLVGVNMERDEPWLYVELVFQNTVGVPPGTTTGVFADQEAQLGARPSTRKAWMKTSSWPHGKSITREFMIQIPTGTPLYFSMSHNGERLVPTGIPTVNDMVPLGAPP